MLKRSQKVERSKSRDKSKSRERSKSRSKSRGKKEDTSSKKPVKNLSSADKSKKLKQNKKVKVISNEVKPGAPIHKSTLNLMINTNKMPGVVSETVFREAVKFIYDNIDKFMKLEGGKAGHNIDNVMVEPVKTSYNFEIGGKYGRLHSHGIIRTVQKSGLIHIDLAVLRTFLDKEVCKCKVSVRAEIEKFGMDNYLRK